MYIQPTHNTVYKNQAHMQIKQLLRWSIFLAAISLATPFVWLKIGPKGMAYYGPDVPDIYILGATILGKDKSFWGIAFAVAFQLSIILYFIISSYITIKKADHKRWVLGFTIINLTLLVLFPFWLSVYIDGVICNSDGAAADLTVYPHLGIACIWPYWYST